MNIKTILFDFDGTLIDTNELIYESFLHTFSTYGYSFTEEEILQYNGPPLHKTFQEINADLAEDMIRTYREHNMAHHDQYVKLFPHVEETLATLKENDFKLGIVSAKMRNGVEHGMEITHISPYFDTIVTVDDIVQPKPHPESVITALDRLQTAPDSAIMIGDNYHDIEAGNRAGTKTAGVAWSLKGETFLRQFQPTYMLQDMRELLTIVGV